MMPALLAGSLALVVYAYVGYPCALALMSLVRRRGVRKRRICPSVSFIIAVHNAEARIVEKIENTMAQMYPAAHLEILVASDRSTDRTDDIVRGFEPRVRLVRAGERLGKEAAQRLAIAQSTGDVLIFSDVSTALAADGVARIVENFADPTVGCASSIDRFIASDGSPAAEGAYVRYEMWLRALETRVHTLVGVSGSFFAARRTVCRQWAADHPSDFSVVLTAVRMGMRAVLDPEAPGYYRSVPGQRREFDRKVRTVLRGIGSLAANAAMLNPFRYGLFAWQLASHKLCRWLVPWALLLAGLVTAALAIEAPVYRALLAAELLCVAAGAAGIRRPSGLLRIPAFFVLTNLAIALAWIRYVRGDRLIVWHPSERSVALPRVPSH